MVVILQQTTDNGKRFVSTIVEDKPLLRTSQFSGFGSTSHNSVTERSAIYKQRIDSLFGYPKKDVKPNKEINKTGGFPFHQNFILPKIEPKILNMNKDKLVLSEDEGYQRIDDEIEPHPDSLNPEKLGSSSSNIIRNVSTVNLNSETCSTSSGCQSDNSGPKHQAPTWRYRTYCNMSSSHFATDLQRQLDKAQGASPSEGRNSSNGILQFPVEYLGNVSIQGSTTALQDLQSPLKSLYLNFLKRKNITSGQLSITGEGLQFEGSRLRLVHSFPTISVWAAIKFVARGEPVPVECAFMPLISDPEGQDKRRLFGKMESELGNAYMSSLGGAEVSGFRNPPIFACVTRDGGANQQQGSSGSECHAFTCKCAEDAIVVAANLYQYLLVNEIKMHKEGESGYGSLTHSSPLATNQNSPTNSSREDTNRPFSSASSMSPTDDTTSGCGSISFVPPPRSVHGSQKHRVAFSDIGTHAPVRPPRRKKCDTGWSGDLNRGYNSDESSSLQKIPLQRKRSFKAATYNRYQRSNPAKVKKRVKISTPPEHGTSDEALERILDRMLHPGGRSSLDDLKPAYKKLILRLALILTQGHRQKKGKEVGKRPQRFFVRPKSTLKLRKNQFEERQESIGNFFKPFSKNTLGKGRIYPGRINNEKTLLNPLINGTKLKGQRPAIPGRSCRLDDHCLLSICSGCICDNCSEKCYCSLPTKNDHRKSVGSGSMTPSIVSISSVQDEQERPIKSTKNKVEPIKKKDKRCGYDTESCAESEKCYCSLQGVKSNGLKVYNINLDTETSDTDTNSYDLEEFKLKSSTGISKVPYETCRSSQLGSSPVKMLAYNPGRRSSSESHETNAMIHIQQISSPGFRRNKSTSSFNDEDIQNARNSPSRRQRKKVLLLSGSSETSSREDLVHGEDDKSQIANKGRSHSVLQRVRTLGDISEDDAFNSSKIDSSDSLNSLQVLEMKKTAEIEAMFTTLNINGNVKCNKDQLALNRKSNSVKCNSVKLAKYSTCVDFQASLGYLP